MGFDFETFNVQAGTVGEETSDLPRPLQYVHHARGRQSRWRRTSARVYISCLQYQLLHQPAFLLFPKLNTLS